MSKPVPGPGRKLDALIAEKVMGYPDKLKADKYDNVYRKSGDSWIATAIPNYSTEIAAAWEVVEKMRLQGFFTSVTDLSLDSGIEDWSWSFVDIKTGSRRYNGRGTAPHAICLAALKAKGVL